MTTHTDEHYYVPHGSHWPAVGSVGLLFMMVGVSAWLNGADPGFYVMLVGIAVIIFIILYTVKSIIECCCCRRVIKLKED